MYFLYKVVSELCNEIKEYFSNIDINNHNIHESLEYRDLYTVGKKKERKKENKILFSMYKYKLLQH